MSFHVIIPARYGATRLPGKPLLEIAGRPMIQWVYDAAAASGAVRVIVATDDERVRGVVARFGGEVCMTAVDHRSGTDRIAEAARKLGLDDEQIIVNLQGDEPLMSAALVRRVAQVLEETEDAALATACAEIHDEASFNDPHVVKVVCDRQGFALYFSRAPIPWPRTGTEARPLRHLGLYAYRAGFLRRFAAWPPCPPERSESLEQLRALWYGARIAVCRVEEAPAAGVDTPADLERVRRLLAEHVVK